jgi:hypothetical protein
LIFFIAIKKYYTYICGYIQNSENMFEFSQYLGFTLTILTIGSVNVFLVSSVSHWVGGATWEAYKEKKLKKKEEQSA